MPGVSGEGVRLRPLMVGFAVGAVIFFAFAFGMGLLLDVDAALAAQGALLVGLVAGGAIGFLVAGRWTSRRG